MSRFFIPLAIFVFILASLVALEALNNNKNSVLQSIRNLKNDKLIIDTDGGADDAIAILLALEELRRIGDLKIEAITTVFGNTNVKQATINILKTLRLYNVKIPVYMGLNSSTLYTPDSDNYFGNDGFGDVPYPNPPTEKEVEEEHATLAMIRLVRKYPGQISIVALGPLTNVAIAIRLDPTFKRNLKSLYWFGGSTDGLGNVRPGVEFNAYMDPESNKIVFNEPGAPIILMSWETAVVRSPVSTEWRLNELGTMNSTIIKFINGIERKSLKTALSWAACDAKLMASVLRPKITTDAVAHHVEHITSLGADRGAMLVDYYDMTGAYKNTIIIRSINITMFQEILIELFS